MYICSVNLPLFCPYKRIRIPRDFCLWNAESGKFLLVGSEILGFGIQNPEFHEWLGSEILVPPTKNSVFSTCISRIHSVSAKTVLDSSGGSRRGALGPSHPLIFDQTEAQRAEKKFLETGPPFFQGLDDCPPPLLFEGLNPLLYSLTYSGMICSLMRNNLWKHGNSKNVFC